MLTLALWMMWGTQAQSVNGYWETPAHSVVQVEPCGSDACLRVVKLPPTAPGGKDTNNPDASLRGRALCGLVVGTGFHPEASDKLSGGHLYDPKTGHTYQGTITVQGDTLHLRGYIGVALFGRSETWKRVAPVAACR
jgi:uncharacterized protein (DUF2147 family)